jgi:hypothetical protein
MDGDHQINANNRNLLLHESKDAKKSSSADSVASLASEASAVTTLQSNTSVLLAVANRFQMPQLVEICTNRLADSITIHNLADSILLADKCNAPRLMV